MKISLIIPAYNEENRIINTMDRVFKFMDKNFNDYEVIVVDDGSTDGTVEILRDYKSSNLKIVVQPQNMGKGFAVKTGMLMAKGSYCFFMDADLPYRLDSIIEAIDVFKKTNSHLVIGSRDLFVGDSDTPYPFYRKFMSKMFSLFINTILNLKISDTQCGFKGFTNYAAKDIFPPITINGFGFDFEMLYIARKYKMSIECIPVNLRHTVGSKVNIIVDSLRMMKDAFKVKLNDWKGLYNRKLEGNRVEKISEI